ncbi:MAG: serine hydrolase [Bacteroidota bacterium]|nr:serine hydrolase [Bacteroidota bacterium]
MKTVLWYLLFIVLFSACIKDAPLKKPYTGYSPVNINDGWLLSTPASEHMDATILDNIYRDVYADENTWMMKSLLVFKNGKLIAESYLKDEADRTNRAAIGSCTIQLTGIITGIALSEGFIESIDDPVGKYLPGFIGNHPDKYSIPIKDMLTMRSGIAFNNTAITEVLRQLKTNNSIDFVLGLEFEKISGLFFDYNDGNPQVVSGIVQYATGKTLEAYGRKVLLEPLGIENISWDAYPEDGITLGAFGIFTTPRELAKVAQCVMDSGKWNGNRIIPVSWCKEMLASRVYNAFEDAAFGYFWWSIPAKGWYFMWSYEGTFAFAIPAKQLLVLISSLPNVRNNFGLSFHKAKMIVDRIITSSN